MFRRIQVVAIIWLLMIIPFFSGLKYIDLSSADSVNSCLDTFLTTENKNISHNLSETIYKSSQVYSEFAKNIDFTKISDDKYMQELMLKYIPCGNKNLVRFKVSDIGGHLLYTSDRYETSDFLQDEAFKAADSGQIVINIISLDEESRNIGISYFFSITKDNNKYFIEVINPISYLDSYLSTIDTGLFPRFFYIISPKFTRYVSMSGLFMKDSEKALGVTLGCHLANQIKKTASDGNKVFFADGRSFSVNINQIRLPEEIIGPKLFAVIAAHSGSIAQLSGDLLSGLPLALIFVAILSAIIAIYMARSFVKMEEELRLSLGITDATPIPVVVFEVRTGMIKQINQPSSILFRSTVEKLIGVNAWKLFVNDKDIEYIKNAIDSQIPVQNYELVMQCVDGATFWSILSASPITIGGSMHAIIGIYDISHRKEIEKKLELTAQNLENQVAERTQAIEAQAQQLLKNNQELENSKKNAEKANEAKSRFLSNMSNELKTPLDAIIGYCEVLIEEAEQRKDDVSVGDLQKIVSTSENMLLLINELLDLSKIEAGKISLSIETFDIVSLVRGIEDLMRPIFLNKNETFTVECPKNIGSMRCDKVKLKQSILNILSSAATRSNDGDVLLKIKDSTRQKVSYVDFIIRDTGKAISPELLERTKYVLSNDFSVIDEDAEDTVGFGISIAGKYCKLLNGGIVVDSDESGSEFIISVPRISQTTKNVTSEEKKDIEQDILKDLKEQNAEAAKAQDVHEQEVQGIEQMTDPISAEPKIEKKRKTVKKEEMKKEKYTSIEFNE